MIRKILTRNKRIYQAYNNNRKAIFMEQNARDSQSILFLLPWLLSINEPESPGYIKELIHPFRVYDIDYSKEIREREEEFKKQFNIKKRGSLLKSYSEYSLIHGLYTIGSVGSVAHTSSSDCDIWVCIDKNDFTKEVWQQLNFKINLIKDWMDTHLKIPVFFFISDINAIRNSCFGNVDQESSGSTQQDVLKEEFYRTCMLICGKTPLWWLCYDEHTQIRYIDALHSISGDDYWEYDLIDFGDIESINKKEYFGAALWQFHKSLSHPLKSMFKILHLKSSLDSPPEKLLCHQFREEVYQRGLKKNFPDYSIFTMSKILSYCEKSYEDIIPFLLECYYLLCEINPYNTKQKLKNTLSKNFLKSYPLEKDRSRLIRQFKSWSISDQTSFGNKLFSMLLRFYRDISKESSGAVSESDRRDLTILGRRISAYYLNKKNKINILKNPSGRFNFSQLTFQFINDHWTVAADPENEPLVSHDNIVHTIAFIAWNSLFSSGAIRMQPNPSSITLREIINLGVKITQLFGSYHSQDISFKYYLKEEYISKALIILDFESSPWYKKHVDYSLIYINCWGELFVENFTDEKALRDFFDNIKKLKQDIEVHYYVQRNSTAYEKIIERVKQEGH